MKKYFYLFSLLFSSFCFSQTYHFDTLIKYSTKNSSNKTQTDFVNYFNTADFSYTLSLSRSESRFVALLLDRGRNLMHYFTVLETKDKGETKFQFKYESSMKKYATKNLKDYYYEISEPSESSPKEVTLKIFKNKKSKKAVLEQTLIVQEAEQNLFPIYQNVLLAHYPTKQKFPENFMVSKAVELCNKCSCEIDLSENTRVALDIKLPEKLKFPGSF